ncbi:hypothetical protein [Apocheima cinerarium nucleopolyhedrovirus]|uniref:hypothetical protein n=1 Tax=Apocheima cinerarium nucleopolyhedrovirus TaxID=307461 RepID=UPI0001D92091|nr:hypothetical protein [Apocheima cinerarium nucleopolyhedrovirus]ADB84419.1 hypothetical protein [Apocheima cinerarium nucleopolyhedrovirus]
MSLFSIDEDFELVLPEESVIYVPVEYTIADIATFLFNNLIILNENSFIEFEPNDDDDNDYDRVNNQNNRVINQNLLIHNQYNKNEHRINDSCYICFEEFKQDQQLITLRTCNHSFCVECITTWLQSGPTKYCPICRTPVE